MYLVNEWSCPKCNVSGNNLITNWKIKDIDKEIANKEEQCPVCKKYSKVEEFIRQVFYESVQYLGPKSINEDIVFTTELNIIVGNSYEVTLEKEINKIVDFNITQYGFFNATIKVDDYIKNTRAESFNKITVLTSESTSENKNKLKCGENSSLLLRLSCRRATKMQFPIWFEYLQESVYFIKEKKYSTALMSMEIAFESFVDKLIIKLLESKGILCEAGEEITISINTMDNKVFKILNSLGGINFKNIGENEHKIWKDQILKKRNMIAHGNTIEISYEEIVKYYKVIVNAIFYMNRESPVDIIYN